MRRLDSARLKRLLADWRRFLGTGDSAGWPESATRPTGEVARRHIWKLYQRFLRKGAAIQAESPDRDLHELRITGKKLRYLVEFFRTLQPPAEIELLIKAMKDIQDFLGDYQDCTVQQTRLDLMARQMTTEGAVPAETACGPVGADQAVLRQRQRRAASAVPGTLPDFQPGAWPARFRSDCLPRRRRRHEDRCLLQHQGRGRQDRRRRQPGLAGGPRRTGHPDLGSRPAGGGQLLLPHHGRRSRAAAAP